MSSTDRGVAICCYTDRAVAAQRCVRCKQDYGCLTFKTTAELVQFNALIPASMLGAPLPLNLWPHQWQAIVSDELLEAAACAADAESPIRLLAFALGMVLEPDGAPPPPSTPEAHDKAPRDLS
ncbi:MAG TPA: hypothetical protein VGI51_04810 [Steroidobacteraceae bacterium]|jgi:hypothetical protein